MKEYKPVLRTSAYDDLSASTLGNTVIGILFEKKGSDVKKAIQSRLDLIVKKITDYTAVSVKIEKFIDEKRKVLKDLDVYYQGRCDDRKAKIHPYQRQVEEIVKKCSDVVFDFDKVTQKHMAERSVKFENGFDQFKTNFVELDEFLKKEEDVVQGVQGSAGIPGVTGIQGCTGIHGLKTSEFYSPQLNSDFLDQPESIRGIGFPDRVDEISEEEETAMSRVETLRNLLQKYLGRLDSLKRVIKNLESERRRLTLVVRNIDDDRSYKFDLSKLSALGFEDIEE